MAEEKFARGIELLRHPVTPLVAMAEFFFMTGDFATVSAIIDQLPEPIETDRARYSAPREQLRRFLDCFAVLEAVRRGMAPEAAVIDESGERLEPFTAAAVLARQQVLTVELETINSLLCGPCGCTLCCVGPDREMVQEYFEIPLGPDELDLFPLPRVDSARSRRGRATDEDELLLEGRPFYRADEPVLIHWQSGWSLIMPKGRRCPNLEEDGRCRVYRNRPAVCRRPQIFPYLVEPVEIPGDPGTVFRLRRTLLAITDCPYVRELQDEIAAYAAASELHLAVNRNKA